MWNISKSQREIFGLESCKKKPCKFENNHTGTGQKGIMMGMKQVFGCMKEVKCSQANAGVKGEEKKE